MRLLYLGLLLLAGNVPIIIGVVAAVGIAGLLFALRPKSGINTPKRGGKEAAMDRLRGAKPISVYVTTLDQLRGEYSHAVIEGVIAETKNLVEKMCETAGATTSAEPEAFNELLWANEVVNERGKGSYPVALENLITSKLRTLLPKRLAAIDTLDELARFKASAPRSTAWSLNDDILKRRKEISQSTGQR